VLADAVPGTVGCLDSFGLVVACGDEWISLGQSESAGKIHERSGSSSNRRTHGNWRMPLNGRILTKIATLNCSSGRFLGA